MGIGQEVGSSAETRPCSYTVGICATGRPPTLLPLLHVVLSSEVPGLVLNKVVLVASDCSEDILEEVREISSGERRMKLIEHAQRSGKADAINEVFRETEGDFLVYVNADAMIGPDAIPILLGTIEKDKGIGFVSGKPVFSEAKGLVAGVLDLMWGSFNLLSSDPDHSRQRNHGTDELMVIRSELLTELPAGLVNDGAYIAGRIREQGYQVRFQPRAVVHIDVPARMIDLIRQRRRILYGHIQVKRLVGTAPRTVETMMFFSPGQSLKIVIRMLASQPKRILILPVAGIGELISVSGALWDTFRSKASHAVWKRYEKG
jgi:cellulose synthase/poly-beta-1,6-N-acetylglucosamine synthase-like glycosyltransferase